MFYYLGCTFCISYLYAILYIHALMLNDMANPNFIAHFVGPSPRFFTNQHGDSINQVERYPIVQKI